MNRIISISLSSLVLIAVFFTMATVHQSCNSKSDGDALTTEEKAVQVADTFTEESYFEEDGTGDADRDQEAPVNSDPSDVVSTTISDREDPPPTTTQPTPQVSSSSQGRYLIVAGNYLVRSNADAMVSRLNKEGFNGAEVLVFDLSQYYSVVAGRYDARSNANRASESLKQKGIDNYVLTKNRQ